MIAQKLKAPIAWTTPDPDIGPFLDRLQGNILKYHGRDNAVFLFCRFRDGKTADARTFLRAQIARMRTAKQQLQAAADKRSTGRKDLHPFVALFLSKPGYDYFGIPHAHQPPDPSFQAGMPAATLGDPEAAEWDSRLRVPHAMILVATDTAAHAQTEATDLLNDISLFADLAHSGEIIGNQFFNTAGRGVENFGYVDGRSQPLVLAEDVAAAKTGNQELPDAGFPVDQFVVRDSAVNDPYAYGSYFVFRQLEQFVRAFRDREELLTVGRDDDFPNRDSAGIGRLESGTPFELRPDDGTDAAPLPPDVTNNFRFTTDPPHCPHFAHIRKVNPRTADTRRWIMIRRGMTYGTRDDAAPDPAHPARLVLADEPKPDQIPVDGVGLLFQAYQANIAAQFETTQKAANSPAGGIDPVIGQANAAPLDWPRDWGSATTDPVEFYSRDGKAPPEGPYVKLRGGGYFFAPSLPFLHATF